MFRFSTNLAEGLRLRKTITVLQYLVKSVRASYPKIFYRPQPYFSTIPRRALAPISGNISYRKELTRYERGVVIGFARGGVKAS